MPVVVKRIWVAVTILLFSLPLPSQASPSITVSTCFDGKNFLDSLTKNLPHYANRIIQTTRSKYSLPVYVITAGKIDTTALPLNPTPFFNLDNTPSDGNIAQVFITTLERQYPNPNRVVETQNFHWLLLTATPQGWTLVKALTRLGYPHQDGFLLSPPRDSTNGIIGQAVQRWLRDCQFPQNVNKL